MAKRELLIGGKVPAGAAEPVRLDADVLTTHGVILGMTGSGKTGLAVVLLEELARQRVPLLICDLKGDLTNLLLTFPRLAPEDFQPYLPVSTPAAERPAAAQAMATRWRQGLAQWGLGEAEITQLKQAVSWRLLTPGSGVAPVNLLPALDAPAGYDPDIDPDGARARLDGTAAGLLALVDRGGDPLSDRDHVLLATLLDAAWRQGQAMDLAELIRQIAQPPVSRFGVLDAETFYPAKERQQLLLAFNTVLASPSFAAWTRGVPLAIDALAGSPEAPCATILYLAHLAERERQSFLTLLFSALLSWVRSQP
ncbi:MAG: ATP-binding protein, partial [Thermoanaerobaculaceae bacterium]|nr:ATP-binding protein [Thermoanaerobaculaceae bacterium]